MAATCFSMPMTTAFPTTAQRPSAHLALFEASTTFLRGDELCLLCAFGAEKRWPPRTAPRPSFGLSTTQDMCLPFIVVCPRPTLAAALPPTAGTIPPPRLVYCVPVPGANGTTSTSCGGKLDAPPRGSLLPLDATAWADTGGLTSPFRGPPDVHDRVRLVDGQGVKNRGRVRLYIGGVGGLLGAAQLAQHPHRRLVEPVADSGSVGRG